MNELPSLEAHRALLTRRRDELAGGACHRGWKLGRDLPGVEGVALGYLTSTTELADGDRYRGAWTSTLRAETEIAIVVGEGLAVALEIVDVARTPESAIVANSFHRAVAYGPIIRNPSIGAATLTISGTRHEADREPDDPDAVLQVVSELLAALGEHLRPGDHVLSGSLVHVSIPPNAQLTATIAGLGDTSVHLGHHLRDRQ
jgi:hypothetical protein